MDFHHKSSAFPMAKQQRTCQQATLVPGVGVGGGEGASAPWKEEKGGETHTLQHSEGLLVGGEMTVSAVCPRCQPLHGNRRRGGHTQTGAPATYRVCERHRGVWR